MKPASLKVRAALLVSSNLCIIIAIVLLFFSYMRDYNDKLYEQNLNDIGNVNQAAAQISSELFASQGRKVNNIIRYVKLHELTRDEIIAYIDDSDADSDVVFQLIGQDYTGVAIQKDKNGNYPQVSYTNKDYVMIRQIVNRAADVTHIPFTVEFTDPNTGSRSFGRYVNISALSDGEMKSYTLMAVFKSAAFIGHINLNSGFDNLSTVLINKDGSYAIRNYDYKADSIFTYLYNYNDLTLDELSLIKHKMLSNDGGSLRYNNSAGEECAFVYTDVPGTDWLCVSCVPLSSFHITNPDFKMTMMLLILLAGMMIIDVIYFAKLNRRLKASVKEAEAASMAKTDFLSRMSHDIRTPLNVISGMTELALLEDNPPETAECLGNIKSSGKFLLGLVNDVLDMNKVESGKMELHLRPYSYKEFESYLNSVIRPLCVEKGIEFTVDCDVAGKSVITDSLRFNQVFFNLLSNAVKFTPRGGHISLTGSGKALENGRIAALFVVRDDGVGMSEEFQRNMFSAFTQEERTSEQNSQGTGLGLAIVKNIVEIMNGTIRVESEINKGSAFYVSLELASVPDAMVKDENEASDSDLGGKRVLLCEDHPLNAKIIRQLLSRKQMLVEHAENGQAGIDMFAASPQGYYDIILMDIRMPLKTGIEASSEIRAMQRSDAKRIPIIALTANAYDSDIEQCMSAGMNAHLTKPVEVQKLYSMLSSSLAVPQTDKE
ncbi:MAG: ATP-binding protein [Eubacteriales bacterium]|nr:ATP-binding protein [Eubacteriales bacterium]MDD3882038.1 ATP-binding protein [Eubacteriales bacterium]MDD4512485.1 ATP-binding protein [Eubacteriales bacterium]